MLLNHGWRFAKDAPRGFAPVQLPHDWLIGDPANFYQTGVGYYRRVLDAGDIAVGKRIYLCFDGVYMDSTLYINGKQACEWKNGCTAFSVDITDYLQPTAKNELLVRVNYQAPNARWYTGAGIYRDVRLLVKNPCHFLPDGIYITTQKQNGKWAYTVDVNAETGGKPYEAVHTLIGPDRPVTPWDIDDPYLYTLHSELWVDGVVTDRVETRFGFREIRFDPNEGFFLNGRHVKLRGVCLHGDLGMLGGAIHQDALRRQLVLMRRMGVNAIRTAHNPPAAALMQLADELGLLVMSEITDVWRQAKTEYDYARFFDDWIARDVAAWVRRDRNHPSLILWSVGNEIPDTNMDAKTGGETLQMLMDLVRRHDPRGNAALTFSSNYLAWKNTQQCADRIKIVGYNYTERLYAQHHQEYPDWVIYGGETGSTVQSRGVYHFPLKQSKLAEEDEQCSSLGNCTTSWGAKNLESILVQDAQTPYSLGQFLWAGQDYIGEPTPYHTKNSYFGMIDTAGFAKDAFHIVRAAWVNAQTLPVLHIFPYWDFSPGVPIDVRVCSNAAAVELFLNGESLGRQALRGRLIADWQIPYREGTLCAVAYDENGKQTAQAERKSFGDAVSVKQEWESFGELRFVSLTAIDAQANPVENCARRVRVTVEGGTLLGLDSGDSTDLEPYQTDHKRMFNGRLLALVKADARHEPVINPQFVTDDVPIRKIELTTDGYTVTASVFPKDATYHALTWRATNAQGIDSPYAGLAISDDGMHAELMPGGDGEIYVRCCAKCGRDHVTVMGFVRFYITGLGNPCLNPYGFIAGGLYAASNVPLGNGNENGVVTMDDAATYVGFRDLDFGSYGSDAVRVPLFPMAAEAFDFELWQGMPNEDGKKLCTLRYTLGREWDVYREAVYTLPHRMRGVQTLCFVFRDKVHFKGFQFVRQEKAFAVLPAAQADSISGDRFSVQGGTLAGIGNNVALKFTDMDFGTAGTARVALRWRSTLAKNAMHILFDGANGTARSLIELPAAPAAREETFSLEAPIFGKQTVTLVFLPGSRLDLEWIRFEA